MRKLFLFLCAALMLTACSSVQKAENFANCTYALRSVEVSDYNVDSLSFIVYMAITNLNRREPAAIKKFEGKMYMNEVEVADVSLENVLVEPASVKNQKVYLTIPMSTFSSKLLGLVSMGSATVDYHLTGTATFDTPLGEVPVPVDIGRMGSNN